MKRSQLFNYAPPPSRGDIFFFLIVVCPSVRHKLCPLINAETAQDIFAKLGTNVEHHQTMYRELEPKFTYNYYEIMPFVLIGIAVVSTPYLKQFKIFLRNFLLYKVSSDDVQRT